MALISVSGHLKDVSGANIAGSVVFQLVNYAAAIPRVIGTNAIAPTNVTVTAAANGSWSTNIQGNDSIDPGATNTPPTTYYVVTFKDQNGANIQSVPFNFLGSGTANLDSQAPLVTIPSPPGPPNIAGFIAAKADATSQGANISSVTLLTPAAGGLYQINGSSAVTRVATVSSTMPGITIAWTDADSSQAMTFGLTSQDSSNVLTAIQSGFLMVNTKALTAISYSTTGYLSSGATSMQYSVHIRLEGPL